MGSQLPTLDAGLSYLDAQDAPARASSGRWGGTRDGSGAFSPARGTRRCRGSGGDASGTRSVR
ncbi:hypothetical protein [Haloplanus halophilus]|uniref:hypothetical protein n=1 Tax=Haloplanus halophilus TaxID=2949993 RepID=UPI00203EEFD3|nr:hypothetical protein [Haloplanus sp. GDY1]